MTVCSNIVTSADELGIDAPADDSNDEYYSRLKIYLDLALNDVEASSIRIKCLTNEVDREAWSYGDAVR